MKKDKVNKDHTYGSIDELLGRHIAPMNDLVEEAINHRKFMAASEGEVDAALLKLKQSNPASIPYAFCWLEDHPGYLSLRYALSSTSNPKHSIVGISPKGFVWTENTYESLDLLTNDFKKKSSKAKNHQKNEALNKQAEKPKPLGQSRWQGKPPLPPQPPPPNQTLTHAPPSNHAPPPMHAPPPIQVAAGSVTLSDWRPPQGPPQLPPQRPPQGPPPPNNWGRQPQPPPPLRQPPPPNLPPPPMNQPVPPSFAQPPAFDSNQQQTSGQGRGRGRTLPAWMNKT